MFHRNHEGQGRALLLILFLIVVHALTVGCQDDELTNLTTDSDDTPALPAGAIVISPLDQTLDLAETVGMAAGSIDTVSVMPAAVGEREADFLMPLKQGRIYVEQNDDREWRTATVVATSADGTQQTITLAQPPATRAASTDIKRNFYRNHGLGYSYDAIGGEYCKLKFVRCQLLNRAVIDLIEQTEIDPFITIEDKSEVETEHSVSTSVTDYVQNSNFFASAEAEALLIFEGSVKATCYAFEDGYIDKYILHDELTCPRARYSLDIANLASYSKKYPNLLTSSFRHALERLAKTPVDDWRSIDEFIETYGTHVVHDVKLGAHLEVDVQVETHKFNLIAKEGTVSEVALKALYNKHTSSQFEQTAYQILRDSHCRIDVQGGDVSVLDELVGMTTFSNDDININPEDITRWMSTVYYDDDDLFHSNVEMVEMEVIPIWQLVEDKDLADRLEMRIIGNAESMQRLLGNRNFINVEIPYPVNSVTCRIGNETKTFSNPAVTDIIAAGRHVATICKEIVPEIDTTNPVDVIYPIYEGRVKLTNGLCIYKGNVYRVDWRYGKFEVTQGKLDVNQFNGNVYLNSGVLSTSHNSKMTYMKGNPILGCERPGGISKEGKLAGKMVKVKKHFGHFYLEGDKEKYSNLPNWTFVDKNPEEAANYPNYFNGEEWKKRMVRNDEYVYLYNTTEIGYE